VQGAPPELLRPARRLLVFSSVVTLALNIAEPVIAGDYGKAAFDAVGSLRLVVVFDNQRRRPVSRRPALLDHLLQVLVFPSHRSGRPGRGPEQNRDSDPLNTASAEEMSARRC